jgi:hypothetical protein
MATCKIEPAAINRYQEPELPYAMETLAPQRGELQGCRYTSAPPRENVGSQMS